MNPNEYGWRCLIKIKFTPLSPPPRGSGYIKVEWTFIPFHAIPEKERNGQNPSLSD